MHTLLSTRLRTLIAWTLILWSVVWTCCLVTQSFWLFCDLMDCSPPGSSVHGFFQARILEWVAVYFLQGIFPIQGLSPRLLHWQVDSFFFCWATREAPLFELLTRKFCHNPTIVASVDLLSLLFLWWECLPFLFWKSSLPDGMSLFSLT